jgi:hypothetical protein
MKVTLQLTLRQASEIEKVLRDRQDRLESWITARHTGEDECREFYEELGIIQSIFDDTPAAIDV